MNPIYLEFREEMDVPLGARIPSAAVPAVNEIVSLRGVMYTIVSRSWLYDGEDEDTTYCFVRVRAHV